METPEHNLCRQCGLCCDGSLFADVRLTDSELGPIEAIVAYEQRDDINYLQQPCHAFCEGDCQIYSKRPVGCRRFECELLKQVKIGETTASSALDTIKRVREEISSIEELLIQLGETEESLPLSFRYESALAQAWDLTEPTAVQSKREQLYQQVTALDSTLQNRFRSSD